jgi:hypothetical protein
MKSITIQNPFAALIALGKKTIEVRTWQPPQSLKVGDDLLICAAALNGDIAKYNNSSRQIAYASVQRASFDFQREHIFENGTSNGHALCVVRYAGCHLLPANDDKHIIQSFVQWKTTTDLVGGKVLWAWHLDDVRPIIPFRVKGQQRLFETDNDKIQFL